jgi:hypothetical protein
MSCYIFCKNVPVIYTHVCGFAATYFEDLNESVFARADQPFRIGLIIDESPNAANDVTLPKQAIKFLSKHADSPAPDFVDSTIEKLKIAADRKNKRPFGRQEAQP